MKLSNSGSALIMGAALALAVPGAAVHAAAGSPTAALAQDDVAAKQRAATENLLQTLDRQTGTIPIAAAKADLVLGDKYYFVGPEQARTILVDVWRNPPASANGVLGMVFPKGKSFVDDTWSAVITFEETGYVSDEDAKTIDYNAMLEEMRASDEAQAPDIRAQGYPAGILQRWAQQPTYDGGRHSLVWARDIKFDDMPEDSLNYDIRLLGREGVLSMNILASMSQLDEVREAAKTFASVGTFRTGARYADYNSATDKKAEYGLAGLVAAGGAAAVAKKVGLLAILAKFGKFIFIGIVALFAMFRNAIGGLFGRKPALEASEWEAPEASGENPEDDPKAS